MELKVEFCHDSSTVRSMSPICGVVLNFGNLKIVENI